LGFQTGGFSFSFSFGGLSFSLGGFSLTILVVSFTGLEALLFCSFPI
jgi:hypothetical protein